MTGTLTSSNATPKTLGEELVRLRTAAGLRLEQIADETKVSPRILGALESGNYRHLPEKVFCRNFVRQHAACVGADPQPLLAAFDQAWERHLLASGIHPTLVVEKHESISRPIRWQFWLPTCLGAAILVVVGVFILGSSPGSQDLQPDPRRSVAVRPSPTSALPTRALPSPSPVNTAPVETPARGEDRSLTLRIEVRAGRECWFHVRDRAGLQEQRLLGSGEYASLDLAEPVKLTLGNAGAVTLEINGRPQPDLGGLGQVVHLEITDSGISPLANDPGVNG